MHIVFFNVLGSGHVNPTLPVVRALVARGDRVTYFCYAERRAEIEAAGATFRNYGSDDFRIAQFHPEGWFPTQLFPAAAGLMPFLLEALDELEPDVVVADNLAPWGAAVARASQIPLVASVTTFAFDPESMDPDLMPSFAIDEVNREALRTLRERWGVQFDEADFPGFLADRNIVYTAEAFNPPLTGRAEDFAFVGPMVSPRTDESNFPLEHYEASAKTRVYISMGTILGERHQLGQSFYQPFFDVMGDRDDLEAVLSVGRALDPADLDAPANFRVERFVPQLELLKHVDVFVTHGGMNSANEALYFGVPLIVIPFGGDQPAVAQRVADHGAGLVVDRDALTATVVSESLNSILGEPSFRAAVEELQRAFRSAPGVPGALAVLDDAVSSG